MATQEASLASTTFVFLMVGTCGLCGLAGGYAGYLLGPPTPVDIPPEQRPMQRRRALVLGLVAAYLVPLFLKLLGSVSGVDATLVDDLFSGKASAGGWMVLAGFALLAGVSSKRFIPALSDKLLTRALEASQQAQQHAERAIERAESVNDTVNDLEEDVVQLAEVASNVAPPVHEALTKEEKDLLVQVGQVGRRRPSLPEIERATGRRAESIEKILADLEIHGLVQSKDHGGTRRWRVRTAGKARIGQINRPAESVMI